MKPKHPDEQEIPFRLRELMRSREAMKRPKPGKRRAAGGTRSCPSPVVRGLAKEPALQLEAARSCSGASQSPPGDVPSLSCQGEGAPRLSLLQ